MMRRDLGLVVMVAAIAPSSALAGGADGFAGTWKTTFGTVTLETKGNSVTGSFGTDGQFPIRGTVTDKVLKATYHESQIEGELTFTLAPSGLAFSGRFAIKNGRSGVWNGWKPDPKAKAAKELADFSGLWLTDYGLMDLSRDGAKVRGKYATKGGSPLDGDVTGRHLEFRYEGFRPGPGWFDLSEDGQNLTGAGGPDGPGGWFGWTGRRAPEYSRHAKLIPGEVVDGSTANLLTYSVRAPEGYKEGDGKPWPSVVILHGSNMNGRAYVSTIAAAWPDIARDYILLGINGESPSRIEADNPAFNYSYINFVGRSTYKGFPGTNRESPALVSEALADLKGAYPIRSYFVGGHSQGGFLTYSLMMNYPEMIAGAFPVSCGLIFQCEPSAYSDEALRKAQRAVPLAIVHAENDPVVGIGMGRYAEGVFGDAGWPAFRFFGDDQAGHMFARLPVGPAIRWLETMNADDPATLVKFAEARMKEGGWRDAVAALARARALDPKGEPAARIDHVSQAIDAEAGPEAKQYEAKIRANADASWIDGFLAFRDRFEFTESASAAMKLFDALREKQKEPAEKAMGEARRLFQSGKRDEGYAQYEEIARKYYASPFYRDVKKALAERK